MRILITGDHGFIGTNLRRFIAERGFDTVVAAPPELREFRAKADAAETLDVRDAEMVSGVLAMTQPDVVIHLAARKGSWFCEEDVIDTINTNLNGSINVALACAAQRVPLIHFGTTAYYDSDDQWRLLTETSSLRPRTLYGHTKYLAEQAVHSLKDRLQYLIVRPVYAYGNIGRFAASRSESWPDVMVREIEAGRMMPLRVDLGAQWAKDYTHVGDVCDATLKLMARFMQEKDTLSGTIVQVGAGKNYRFGQIIEAFEAPFQVIFEQDRDYKKHQAHDYTRLHELLPGWRSKVDVLEFAQSRGQWIF